MNFIFSSNWSYASIILSDSKVAFLAAEKNATLCPFLYCVLLVDSVTSNFLVFSGILMKPSALLLLIFSILFSSSYPVISSSWLLIIFGSFGLGFQDCLWADSWNFLSTWWVFLLLAFSFALHVLFLLLISCNSCHAIPDCLSCSEFLILSICLKFILIVLFGMCWLILFRIS